MKCETCKHSKSQNMMMRYPKRAETKWFQFSKWEQEEVEYEQLFCILNPIHIETYNYHSCSQWEDK